MSGIVNSAGSKSGVIGETEIDYERGTWVPVFHEDNNTTVAGGTLYAATYTKVGNICSAQVYWSPASGVTRIGRMSLPFAGITTGGNCRHVGSIMSYNMPIANKSNEVIVTDGTAYCAFWMLTDDSASYFYITVDSNTELFITNTYQTET